MSHNLTVKQIAARLNVSIFTILSHIHAAPGKPRLHALNIGTGRRHNYRISEADYQAFLSALEERDRPKPVVRRKRRANPKAGAKAGRTDWLKKWGMKENASADRN